jgi:hypothetical protein
MPQERTVTMLRFPVLLPFYNLPGKDYPLYVENGQAVVVHFLSRMGGNDISIRAHALAELRESGFHLRPALSCCGPTLRLARRPLLRRSAATGDRSRATR